jgi:hypothetical protein
MATYETGTATGTADLITKLGTFAESLGWTVSSQTNSNTSFYPNSPATPGKVFSKGSLVFGVGYASTFIATCGATAVDGAAVWNRQTNSSITNTSGMGSFTNEMTGPYQAYHFFGGTSPDYLHVVVEISAGVFRHFHLGELVKAGSYTGGAYFTGTFWLMSFQSFGYFANSPDAAQHNAPFDYAGAQRFAVRANIDGKATQWHTPQSGSPFGVRSVVRLQGWNFLQSLHQRSPSEFNQLTPFFPIQVHLERSSSLWSNAGYVPDMRYLNFANLSPGEVVTLGDDEWMVFPLVSKTAIWGNTGNTPEAQIPSSGPYGFAYKRN